MIVNFWFSIFEDQTLKVTIVKFWFSIFNTEWKSNGQKPHGPVTQGYSEIWFQIWKLKKENLAELFLSKIWWLDTLKRIEKIVGQNAFEQKKDKPGLKFNPGMALKKIIGLWTTEKGK